MGLWFLIATMLLRLLWVLLLKRSKHIGVVVLNSHTVAAAVVGTIVFKTFLHDKVVVFDSHVVLPVAAAVVGTIVFKTFSHDEFVRRNDYTKDPYTNQFRRWRVVELA